MSKCIRDRQKTDNFASFNVLHDFLLQLVNKISGKITKKRRAKFKTANAFCKHNCFAQKNQTV